ncbi:MAG: DinB family protein, partial [Thermoanaerobaculia bacterium]|nr:DinB family protein [Thermoanaerobaculia bacterium]
AGMEKKLIALAEATPAEKFAWRPAEGVRSVGEVYAHVAGGNYFLMSLLGVKPPAGIDLQTLEASLEDKAAIIAAMKDSFKFANAEIEKMSDADLDKAMKFFGQDTTARGIVMFSIEHVSEHLGQSIAYARMNGITPPWSK